MADAKTNKEYYSFLGALIGLARTIDSDEQNVVQDTWIMLADGLLLGPERLNTAALRDLTERLHAERARLSPQCAVCSAPCGRKADCDIESLRESESTRTLKTRIFSAAQQIAANVIMHRAQSDAENRLLLRAVFSLGEEWDEEFLKDVAEQCIEACSKK